MVFGAITRRKVGKILFNLKKETKKERRGQKRPENAFLALLRNSVWEERAHRNAKDEVLYGLGESDG